jgi:hypothetical protein
MDITQIVTMLEKRADAAAKGEFETTAEYGQRIAALDRQPLVGSVTSNDLIAIEIPNLTASYDADNQKLNVEIRMETPFIGASIDLTQRYLKTNYAYHPSGTYIGSNALGMKRKIEKYQMWYYGLLIMNHAEFVKDEGGDKLKYAIALDRQSAIQAKPTLRALAIVRLYTPYIII